MSTVFNSGKFPETAEEYERRVHEDAEGRVTGADAKAVLRDAGEHGYGGLSADEARHAARTRHPEAWASMVEEHVRRYRWMAARGLHVSYGRLEAAELSVGVVPDRDDGTKNGSYASADDVRAVYAAVSGSRDKIGSVSVRICFEEKDRALEETVLGTIAASFEVSKPFECPTRGGGTASYFDILVPIR